MSAGARSTSHAAEFNPLSPDGNYALNLADTMDRTIALQLCQLDAAAQQVRVWIDSSDSRGFFGGGGGMRSSEEVSTGRERERELGCPANTMDRTIALQLCQLVGPRCSGF